MTILYTAKKKALSAFTSASLLHTLNNPNAYGTSTGDNFGYSVSVETMQLSEPSLRETLEALTQAKPIFLT